MPRPFAGRRVLLGVTGGIASYKSALLARLLHKAGADVDVVLTRSATEFVGPITFEALTGRAVHTELIERGNALDHIRLAREAELVMVAPATADFLARIAAGRADDLLSACLLATTAPVFIAPAMNDRMWSHAAVQENVARVRKLGYTVLDPVEGDLAAGEGQGPGRLPEPEVIFAHAARLLEPDSPLRGRKVVVSAGPTREPLDPVRFLSNHSSGRMGVAIAAAAWRRGADVRLIAGPLAVPAPVGAHVQAVDTTEHMRDAIASAIGDADVLVMAAAPADFRPADPAARKIKKRDGLNAVGLEETPDILASTRESRAPRMIAVGFALETNDVEANARAKLAAKDLDLVVTNDATEAGAGFGHETNRVTILGADGAREELPLLSKDEVADRLLDHVERLLDGR